MSEELTKVNETESTNVEPVESNDPTKIDSNVVTDLIQKDTHMRVLKESQKFKQRALDAETRLGDIEKSRLEEQGKYKEIAEQYKTKIDEMTRREVSYHLNQAVTSLASKAGCVDVNGLMKLGDTQLLQYDTETGEVHGVELFIANAKENYSYLFTSPQRTSVNPITPGGTVKPPPVHTLRETVSTKDGFKDALANAFK